MISNCVTLGVLKEQTQELSCNKLHTLDIKIYFKPSFEIYILLSLKLYVLNEKLVTIIMIILVVTYGYS